MLILQDDGNLIIWSFGKKKTLWSSATNGKGGFKLCMQVEGNLVLYTEKNVAIWYTPTNNNPGAYAEMQFDGQLAVWKNGRSLWTSGVTDSCVQTPAPTAPTVQPNSQNPCGKN